MTPPACVPACPSASLPPSPPCCVCLCSRAYPARIRYIEGEVGRALRKHSHIVCQADCGVCQTASLVHSRRLSQQQMAAPAAPAAAFNASVGTTSSSQHALAMAGGLPPVGTAAAASSGSLSSSPGRSELRSPPSSPHYLLPAAGAAERQGGEEWQELEGHWCSIMLIGGQQFSSTATLCMHEYGSWHLLLVDRRGGINSQHMSPLLHLVPGPWPLPPLLQSCPAAAIRPAAAWRGTATWQTAASSWCSCGNARRCRWVRCGACRGGACRGGACRGSVCRARKHSEVFGSSWPLADALMPRSCASSHPPNPSCSTCASCSTCPATAAPRGSCPM